MKFQDTRAQWRDGKYGVYRKEDSYFRPMTAEYANTLEAQAARGALAERAWFSLTAFVSGLRSGWWGRDSGEMEEGELQQAEQWLKDYDALAAQDAEGGEDE